MKGRKIIKWVFTGILVATIIGYSCFVLYNYFIGPRIIILSPEGGFSTTTPVITIVGRTIHTSTASINGAETPSDLNGNFQSRLILAEGYNIMKVTAKDRYGRVVEEVVEITLLPGHLTTDTASRTIDMGTNTIQRSDLREYPQVQTSGAENL